MNLEGKAGIVTGAGRGIGRGIAMLMAREGAKVVVNDPGAGRNGEVTEERPADEVVAEITQAGGKAIANYDSVANYVSAGRMVRQCADTFGRIDFVVNSAGMLRERMIWNMTEDDFDAVISVHLKGTWNMCHHAIKLMRGERFGRIVNFSSDAFKGSVGQCNYAAAKAGVIGLTRTIARECGRYGITGQRHVPVRRHPHDGQRCRDRKLEAARRNRASDPGGVRDTHEDARPRVRSANGRLSLHGRGEGRERPDLPRREIALPHIHLRRGRALDLQVREQRRVHGRRTDQPYSGLADGRHPERRSGGGGVSGKSQPRPPAAAAYATAAAPNRV